MQIFSINSKSAAHMVAQIRAKQLSTRDSQHEVQASIVEAWEDYQVDASDKDINKNILESLKDFCCNNQFIYSYLKKQTEEDVGTAIKYNITDFQNNMAYKYAQNQHNLIAQIKNGKFYHGLSNNVDSNELPILGSDNKTLYWGNENSSVSSILLESISNIIDAIPKSLAGAATFYPFNNELYNLPDEILEYNNYDNDFVSENGVLLFGDYQFDGQGCFKDQLIFGSEDCITSVAKATCLTTEQIKSIGTNEAGEHSELVTTLNTSINQNQLNLIKPGDIYFCNNHAAIIATKPDNNSKITTLQFSIESRKDGIMLGGGVYDYNLNDEVQKGNVIHISRVKNLEPIYEEISLQDLLNKIDGKYDNLYPDGPAEDLVGDCSIFLE